MSDSSVTHSPAPNRQETTRQKMTLAGMGVVVVAIIVLALTSTGGPLTPLKAIVLGVVEGITEYLPISSTGHLLVTERLLGLTGTLKDAADTYAIVIQVGAILAVVAVYWQRIVQMLRGLIGRDTEGRHLLVCLIIAFIPAAVVGVVLGDTIKEHLFGPWPIIVMWALGGLFLLWWKPRHDGQSLMSITYRQAAIIGAAQVLALLPGTSRSLATIIGALAVGLSMTAAVEFSFLLGLATLTAATLLDLSKDGGTVYDTFGWRTPLLGILVAFVTAVIAVRWLVSYLRTRPLTIFGWYRLGVAAFAAVLVVTGRL